jgi:hypothetical protein
MKHEAALCANGRAATPTLITMRLYGASDEAPPIYDLAPRTLFGS